MVDADIVDEAVLYDTTMTEPVSIASYNRQHGGRLLRDPEYYSRFQQLQHLDIHATTAGLLFPAALELDGSASNYLRLSMHACKLHSRVDTCLSFAHVVCTCRVAAAGAAGAADKASAGKVSSDRKWRQ